MSTMFKVFKRSCRNWEEFARARKFFFAWAMTETEARAMCERFNNNRSAAQIRKGTKLEYTRT